jgi:Zn-dependent protease with chaperone function
VTLNEVERLARNVMDHHGLRTWRFVIDDQPDAIGVCHYNVGLITIRSDVIERGNGTEIMAVLLHEIAHALCPGDGHGKVWHTQLVDLIRERTWIG